MEKICLYSRVSLSTQQLDSQADSLRKWAENQYEIVEEFGEKVSGFDLTVERTEYDKMKEFVLQNDIKRIACWELSRFGRDNLHTLNEIDFFTKKGINIFFKKENIWSLSTEPMTKLLLSLLSSISEMERENIISRSIRGRTSSALKGKACFGILPYGFGRDKNGFLIIEPEEAKVIKLIYSLGLKGTSLRGIATYLNSISCPTRNTLLKHSRTLNNGRKTTILWRNNTIRKILHSKLYKGERLYRNEILLKIPQIISTEIWDKIQERFKENIGYFNRAKNPYLFSSRLRCRRCGLIYSSSTRNGVGFYECSGRKDKGIQCKNGQIKSEFLDNEIWKYLFNDKDIKQILYKNSMEKLDNTEILKQIEFYKNEIEKLELKKKRNVRIYSDGDYTENEYRIEQGTIKNLKTEYSNKLKSMELIPNKFNPYEFYKEIQKTWLTNDFSTKRNIIENLIEKILIYKVDKKIELEIFVYGLGETLKLTLTNI